MTLTELWRRWKTWAAATVEWLDGRLTNRSASSEKQALPLVIPIDANGRPRRKR